MTSGEIKRIRLALEMTQAQFAQLLGVHAMTVSKWDRGDASPTPHNEALLRSFEKAAGRHPDAGPRAAGNMAANGVAYALFKLLEAAHCDKTSESGCP